MPEVRSTRVDLEAGPFELKCCKIYKKIAMQNKRKLVEDKILPTAEITKSRKKHLCAEN